MDTIKALRRGAGIPLGEAKLLVESSLPFEWQAKNERLRDAAEQALGEDVDSATQERVVDDISHDSENAEEAKYEGEQKEHVGKVHPETWRPPRHS